MQKLAQTLLDPLDLGYPMDPLDLGYPMDPLDFVYPMDPLNLGYPMNPLDILDPRGQLDNCSLTTVLVSTIHMPEDYPVSVRNHLSVQDQCDIPAIPDAGSNRSTRFTNNLDLLDQQKFLRLTVAMSCWLPYSRNVLIFGFSSHNINLLNFIHSVFSFG